ncbi:MAG TPA: cytochrome c biogenesis protein CcsA [Methylomirabilota bacterium]|nr:cytochrome c biogenesis protein CcsA [Methylomirabilota bacterium]
MNAVVFDVALTAYIVAAAAAVGSLLGHRDALGRFARLTTELGWVCHTAAIVMRGIDLGRVPLLTLAEALSALIWVVVLLELWLSRRSGLGVLGAFVLPVVLVVGMLLPTGLRVLVLEPQGLSGLVVVHVTLVLIGLAALVINFGSALMYVLQERQLKSHRIGAFYYRLPSLETLDRLTLVTLTAGFPFLTVGLVLGAVSAGWAWGRLAAYDPLVLVSTLAWVVYAATLGGRALGHWRGRRAAYFAIAGFCALLITLGIGIVFQGRHGL